MKVDFEMAYDCVSWGFLRYLFGRMGFGQKWLSWMEGAVFSSSLSVLVNGSPTKEFIATRGLIQGDPLSPFLFLLVAEGLAGLTRNAVSIGGFRGFHFLDSIRFELLQFAVDTVIICDASWDNLWCIKAISRDFELVSGLRINFNKSMAFGINISEDFLLGASAFLPVTSGKFLSFFLVFQLVRIIEGRILGLLLSLSLKVGFLCSVERVFFLVVKSLFSTRFLIIFLFISFLLSKRRLLFVKK